MVILTKDNVYFRRVMLRKLGASTGAKATYSMWHGYLERTDLAQFLESHGIELIEIHTSGHANVADLNHLKAWLYRKRTEVREEKENINHPEKPPGF